MTKREKREAQHAEEMKVPGMSLAEQRQHFLKAEENWLAGKHHNLYRECLNDKLLKDRKTDQEIRDGLILYHHVFGVCVKNS
jgi:hypothetical protein